MIKIILSVALDIFRYFIQAFVKHITTFSQGFVTFLTPIQKQFYVFDRHSRCALYSEISHRTACRYCVSHCPQELDIPTLLELYNEHCFTENAGLFAFIAPMALMSMPEDKRPGACAGCGSCEAVCPQNIKISGALEDFAGKLSVYTTSVNL